MSVSGKILSHNIQVKRPTITGSVSSGQFLLKSQCSLSSITSQIKSIESQMRANIIKIHCKHVENGQTIIMAKLNLKLRTEMSKRGGRRFQVSQEQTRTFPELKEPGSPGH